MYVLLFLLKLGPLAQLPGNFLFSVFISEVFGRFLVSIDENQIYYILVDLQLIS